MYLVYCCFRLATTSILVIYKREHLSIFSAWKWGCKTLLITIRHYIKFIFSFYFWDDCSCCGMVSAVIICGAAAAVGLVIYHHHHHHFYYCSCCYCDFLFIYLLEHFKFSFVFRIYSCMFASFVICGCFRYAQIASTRTTVILKNRIPVMWTINGKY